MDKLHCSPYQLSAPGLSPSLSGRSLRASPDLRSPRGRGFGMPLTVSQNTLRLGDLFLERLRRCNTAYIVPCGQGLTLLFHAFQTRRIGEVIERIWPALSGEGRLG